MSTTKARPTNKEIKMNENDFIVSKTNEKGIITYCNEIFIAMAGYEEKKLIGKNHNIIRHPDMPQAAFKLAWDLIKNKKEFFGFVKNITSDGSYYWVFANITPDYNESGKIIGYTSVRRKPKQSAIDIITPIYLQMRSLEKSSGIDASFKYLLDLLDKSGVTYDEFVISLQGN